MTERCEYCGGTASHMKGGKMIELPYKGFRSFMHLLSERAERDYDKQFRQLYPMTAAVNDLREKLEKDNKP